MKLKVRVTKILDGTRFMASCLSLPGCTVNVATKEEIKPSIRDAIDGYLFSMNSFAPYDIVFIKKDQV